MTTKHPKAKPIDLGALQDAYAQAKRTLELDTRALAKAQEAADRSKIAFQEAHAALMAASRSVLA